MLIPILGLMLSAILEFVSLWQLEILEWDNDNTWDAPFYLFKLQRYVARDLWYAVQVFAWCLGMVSAYALAVALR